jgi:soluble cytochrome b562
MQEFGRPGEGAATVRNYLGDIERRADEEKNYPTTSAALQHQKYMAAGQGAEVPEHLREMKAQIDKTEAEAKAKLNPPQKLQHFIIDDPQNPGQPKAVNFDQHTGAYLDPDTGLAIPGAKPWEKPEHTTPPTIKYDSGIPVGITAGGKTYDIHDPALPPELKPLAQSATGAHKQHLDEEAQRQAAAARLSQSKSDDKRSATDSATVERETRTNIRKAQQAYRDVEEKTSNMDNFLGLAKGGNKAAAQMVPVEGALQISTTAGTKRINRTEVEAYGGAGDLYDRIMGKIGKGVSGKGITDDVLDDMKTLSDVLKKAGWEKYNSEYDDEIGIAKNNGLDKIEQHLPRIQQHAAGGNTQAAGAAAGGAQPLPSFAEWKAKQAKQ